jgi:hypothetical protein
MKRYVAALLVVLGVVGVVGVLAVGTGFADAQKPAAGATAGAKCSKATLHGTYLFAQDGVHITGKDRAPFAIAGMEKYDGNGNVKTVLSANFNGDVVRHERLSGTYTVKANCTGTVTYSPTEALDVFIAPNGSMFTFVQVKPPQQVTSGFELQGTAKRVGD